MSEPGFDQFVGWLQVHAPRVLKMDSPFTPEEYRRIREKCDPQIATQVLIAMHNTKPLLKKYVSANLTFLAWYRSRTPLNNGKRFTNQREQDRADIEKLKRSNDEFLNGLTGSGN